MNELVETYSFLKEKIKQKQIEFTSSWNEEELVLKELIFCLCTPMSRAEAGWHATCDLYDSNLLDMSEQQIAEVLSKNGVRFKNKKAQYIREAINKFSNTSLKFHINTLLSKNGVRGTRNKLSEEIKGLGLKEASHFLRNIGWGNDVCILDRHILRQLESHTVVSSIEKFNKSAYLFIEEEMINFANRIDIPVFALDFVFWANTHDGKIFK